MAEILKQRLAALEVSKSDETELRKIMEALLDGVRAVAAKLDADGTVTGTDYAATFDTYITK